MTALVLRADARRLPLPDRSVDLVCTSPPYFGLRSYQDGGEHYAGQIGDEPTPAEFVDALLAVTAECVRVLKPSGSIWVNLGDKYSGAQQQNSGRQSSVSSSDYWRRTDPKRTGIPNKSLMGVPWRYALRCIDELGLILRAEVIWSKPNGLPESVTDRVRRSHEQWFHFTVSPRYFSAVDEVREPYDDKTAQKYAAGYGSSRALAGAQMSKRTDYYVDGLTPNPLGKLPGSVWTVPTEPLRVPEHLGVDHFAAFPTEFPRRIVQGWSPSGVCVECGEGRRPVVASVGLNLNRPQARRAQQLADDGGLTEEHFRALLSVGVSDTGRGAATQTGTGKNTPEVYALAAEARDVLGGYAREYLLRRPTGLAYACSCGTFDAAGHLSGGRPVGTGLAPCGFESPLACKCPATRPSVVLDPFGGTGTTALVAHALGRVGVSCDLSHDYSRLARWRTTDRGELARALKVDKPPVQIDGQDDLFGGAA